MASVSGTLPRPRKSASSASSSIRNRTRATPRARRTRATAVSAAYPAARSCGLRASTRNGTRRKYCSVVPTTRAYATPLPRESAAEPIAASTTARLFRFIIMTLTRILLRTYVRCQATLGRVLEVAVECDRAVELNVDRKPLGRLAGDFGRRRIGRLRQRL